jgi:hypothetical protein
MTRKRIDVAVAFSSDPYVAEHLADKNFDLAVRHDPSLNQQAIKFDSWPFRDKKTGAQMYGAKYFYWVEYEQETVSNHPSIKDVA